MPGIQSIHLATTEPCSDTVKTVCEVLLQLTMIERETRCEEFTKSWAEHLLTGVCLLLGTRSNLFIAPIV